MFIVLQAPGHTSSELRALWSRLLIFRLDAVCDSLKNYMVVQVLWRELLGASKRVGPSSERCLLELRLPDAHWVSLFVFLASHPFGCWFRVSDFGLREPKSWQAASLGLEQVSLGYLLPITQLLILLAFSQCLALAHKGAWRARGLGSAWWSLRAQKPRKGILDHKCKNVSKVRLAR